MSAIEYINSSTLATATATVAFSSIPNNYIDLHLVISGRNTNAVTTMTCWLNFNSDPATNTSATYLSGNGTAASSSRLTSMMNMQFFNVPAASASASIYGLQNIDILSYSNTNVYKTCLVTGGDAGVAWAEANVGLWRSTSAINSITIGCNGGSWTAGSTFTLWGVK